MKAIIFINIWAVLQIVYLITIKKAMNEKHVNVLDIILMRTAFVIIASFIMTKCQGYTLHVPED